MHITLDTFTESAEGLRALAALCLTLTGDLQKEQEPVTTPIHIVPPPPPVAATAPAVNSAAASVVANSTSNPAVTAPAFVSSVPPPPPPPPVVPLETSEDDEGGNVIRGNFPMPPPPPPISVATPAVVSIVSGTPASAPVAASPSPVSVAVPAAPPEFDSAGMTWDARIHQKGKSKKKDGTWKLQKGIDGAIVQAVVAELAGRAPAAAPAVTLPGAVPVPPVPSIPAPPAVPAPPVPPSMSVPPPPPAGGVPPVVTPFRQLLEKITRATRDGKLQPAQVMQLCQMHGAPNLTQLNAMPHLIPDVSASVDAAILGL